MPEQSPLDWLMAWYHARCDGDWEHGYGIHIGTLDNPGWTLRIALRGTPLDGREFSRVEHRYDHDTAWWTCWTEKNEFHGAGGPVQLGAMIDAFSALGRG